MVQMKKILGILLALCFVLSVTAGAASAHADSKGQGHYEKQVVKHVEWQHGKKVVWFTTEWVWVTNHHHHGNNDRQNRYDNDRHDNDRHDNNKPHNNGGKPQGDKPHNDGGKPQGDKPGNR